jgi:plastocyanin
MMSSMTKGREAVRRIPVGLRWVAVAGIVVLGLAACNSSDPAGDVASGAASDADAITMVMRDQSFDPAELELEPGEEVTVEVTNDDDMAHDFAIESLDLNTGTVEAGEVANATFTVPERGVEFVCTFHPEMTGRIEVK